MTQWTINYNNVFTDVIESEEYAQICDRLIREREEMYPFIGDSRDYYVLYEAAEAIAEVPGLICEIGLRQGGGTKTIIDAIHKSGKERTFISIDPYGSIPFEGMDDELAPKTDYSNAMQKDTLEKMYRFMSILPKINFLFFPLEDTEFCKRYADGVPTYVNNTKEVVNEYALVHFDGPHSTSATMKETRFFIDKTPIGAIFVFDDVKHFYDHDKIKDFLYENGWEQIQATNIKASYVRTK